MTQERLETLTLSRSGWHTRLKEIQVKPVVAILIAAALGLVLSVQDYAFACAVCGVDSEPGFLWSMGFLISMPFVIATVTGGYFVYNSRRAKRAPANKGIFTD